MKLQQTTLAAALSAVLAMGVSGQASAYIYAQSGLQIQELSIYVGEIGGTPPPPCPCGEYPDSIFRIHSHEHGDTE